MAVVTLYMSDLDPGQRMFKSKKDADEHDKKLELAESLSVFISQHMTTIDEELAESLGMLIAENKDSIALAFKGKPDALLSSRETEEPKEIQDSPETKQPPAGKNGSAGKNPAKQKPADKVVSLS